jgi:hypothetical protein
MLEDERVAKPARFGVVGNGRAVIQRAVSKRMPFREEWRELRRRGPFVVGDQCPRVQIRKRMLLVEIGMLLFDRVEQLGELFALELLKRFRPTRDRRYIVQRSRLRLPRGRTKHAMPPHALALQDHRDDREENDECGCG